MPNAHARKWTAFYLSLAVPGAGQLWARSAWSLPWWLGAALAAAGWNWVRTELDGGWLAAAAQAASLLAMGVVSAEHARRLAERDERGRPSTPGVRSRVRLGPRRGRRMEAFIELDIPAAPADVWRRVADVPRFLTTDPFHDCVTLLRPTPAPGVDLVLSHNAFGRRFLRFGRILQWREGRGYAFSDLSPRGPRSGFPHVFFIDLAPAPASAQATRLTIAVRGKWTNRWIPVALGRLWIYCVSRDHARLLCKAL